MRKVSKTKVVSVSIHSVTKYFWRAFHVPDSVLGTRDTTVSKIYQVSAFMELAF